MLTLVDDYSIHVGDNVLFAPNVILRPIDKIILNTVIKIWKLISIVNNIFLIKN